MTKVIIVNKNNKPLGLKDKIECHLGEGVLHRAFSVFVFNNKGELLLQKRSERKLLWPLYWSNTCCSHPFNKEDYLLAGKRRLNEEMGFTCNLELIGSFRYKAKYKDIGSENELCFVLVGKYDGDVNPNFKEVADSKWMEIQQIKNDIRRRSNIYTPWFKIEMEKFFAKD